MRAGILTAALGIAAFALGCTNGYEESAVPGNTMGESEWTADEWSEHFDKFADDMWEMTNGESEDGYYDDGLVEGPTDYPLERLDEEETAFDDDSQETYGEDEFEESDS